MVIVAAVTSTSPAGRSGFDRDEIFDVLSNSRRRQALRLLHQREHAVAVAELVDHVAQEEAVGENRPVSEKLRASVYSSMVQSHLPKMHDYGFIEYDTATQSVILTERSAMLFPYLGFRVSPAVRWYHVYLILAILMGGLAIANRFDLPIITRLTPFDLFGFFGVVVGIVAVFHLLAATNQE